MAPTNLQVFQAQMAAFASMDVDKLLSSFAEGAVLQDMSSPGTPWTGLAEIRGFLEEYFSHLEDLQVTIASSATNETQVFAELEARARYAVDPSSPSDAHDVLMRYAVVETFSEGRIVHERFYWDAQEFESQLSTP